MNRVIIPEHDFANLRQLEGDGLQHELDRADVVPGEKLPGNVVTMHARVRYIDETTGERRCVTLVYPDQTNLDRGRISVLAPVGAALLGLSTGDVIEWDFPHGARRLRVEKVVQPSRFRRRAAPALR
jgi:regulator of nucleoside diphosphate kinase